MRRYASLELKLNNCKWSVHLIGDKGCLMIHHLHIIHRYEHFRISYFFTLQSDLCCTSDHMTRLYFLGMVVTHIYSTLSYRYDRRKGFSDSAELDLVRIHIQCYGPATILSGVSIISCIFVTKALVAEGFGFALFRGGIQKKGSLRELLGIDREPRSVAVPLCVLDQSLG